MEFGIIIEIETDDTVLKINRGFIHIITPTRDEKIPFDHIVCIIISNYSATISGKLIEIASKNNITIIYCDNKKIPCSIIYPINNHYKQSHIFEYQIKNHKKYKNNIWKQIIKQKIINQAKCLNINGNIDGYNKLKNISKKVKSGDKTNCEGYSASIYFKELFGRDFKRDRNKNDINILLNYGYIIARSMVARNLIAVGLSPMIGIFHTNDLNTMRLVDDIIEPIRPIIDNEIVKIINDFNIKDNINLTYETKQKLSQISKIYVTSNNKITSLNHATKLMCYSVVNMYCENDKKLALPIFI